MIQRLSHEEVIHLRHKVLRAHQPVEEARYDVDTLEDTLHLGFFDSQELKGVITAFPENQPELGEGGWRFRGMAVDKASQGKGMGSALLNQTKSELKNAGAKYLWCNARITACGFYARLGFQTFGSEFDIPGIGAHFIMWCPIE